MTALDFTDPRSLTGISKDIRPLILRAADLGWTGRRTTDGGIYMVAPDGSEHMTIPNGRPRVNIQNQLERKVTRWVRRADDDHLIVPEPLATDDQNVIDQRIDPVAEVLDELAAEPDTGRTLVSQRSYLARRAPTPQGVGLYESAAMDERVWSDGTKTYKCKACDFERDTPMAVAAHRRAHPTGVKPGPAVAFTPDRVADTRVNRLTAEISDALSSVRNEGEMDQAVMARRLAERIITRRREHEPEPRTPEPRTPQEVVAAIRALVAGDVVANTLALETRVTELSAEVEKAKAQARRAKETLAALSAMAQEEAGGTDAENGT